MTVYRICIALFGGGLLGLAFRSFKRGQLSQLIPSICWFFLMMLPFAVEGGTFHPDFLFPQFVGIIGLAIALLAGDVCGLHAMSIGNANDPGGLKSRAAPQSSVLILGYVLMLVAIGLHLAHLFLMPEIPLVVRVMSILKGAPKSSAELALLRDSSSKALTLPRLVMYAFQAGLTVVAPSALFILVRARKWRLALLFFLFEAFYSRSTLAKGPIYMLAVTCIVPVWFSIDGKMRCKLLMGIIAAGSLPALFAFKLLLFSPNNSAFRFRASEAQYFVEMENVSERGRYRAFTMADHVRLRSFVPNPDESFSYFEGWVNFVAYRAFLGPVEVASRWYTYFPKLHGGFLGGYGLTASSRNAPGFRHPANLVGTWAYASRFPYYYLDTITANTSADSDAYSHWGFWGIFGTCLVVFGIRWILAKARVEDMLGSCFDLLSLLLFGLLLPAASVWAILLAQGFGLMILIVVAYRWANSHGFNQWVRAELTRDAGRP